MPLSASAAEMSEVMLLAHSSVIRRTASGVHRRGSVNIGSGSQNSARRRYGDRSILFSRRSNNVRDHHVVTWMSPRLFARMRRFMCVVPQRRSEILSDLCGTSWGIYVLCGRVVQSEP